MTSKQRSYMMALWGAFGGLLGWALAGYLGVHLSNTAFLVRQAIAGFVVGGFLGIALSAGSVHSGGPGERPILSGLIGGLVGAILGSLGGGVAEGVFYTVLAGRNGILTRMLSWCVLGLFFSFAPLAATYCTAARGAAGGIPGKGGVRQRLRSNSLEQIISTILGGCFGGAVGGILMHQAAESGNLWMQCIAYVAVGAVIGATGVSLSGIITLARFEGQILGLNGRPLPADKQAAVKAHSLDGQSEKFIGTQVNTGSDVRMYPESECKAIHARIFPKGGMLYIEGKEGDLYTPEGKKLAGAQPLTNGYQFVIGKALMTYHEQRRVV